MRRSPNVLILLLVFLVFGALVVPTAGETGCDSYYANCQDECGKLKSEIADLDYNARAVFDCHERLCEAAFKDKFCAIAEYAPCMQNVLNAYFSCMRNCAAEYRQTTDTRERSDIRNFCPGECICNYYRDLYLTCDKSVCNEYCKEQGYVNSEFVKTSSAICTSGSRKEYQYNCECSGTQESAESPLPSQPAPPAQPFIPAQPLIPAQPVQQPQQPQQPPPAEPAPPVQDEDESQAGQDTEPPAIPDDILNPPEPSDPITGILVKFVNLLFGDNGDNSQVPPEEEVVETEESWNPFTRFSEWFSEISNVLNRTGSSS
jgi:hypothetical protein